MDSEIHKNMARFGFFQTGRILEPMPSDEVLQVLMVWYKNQYTLNASCSKKQAETRLAKAGWFQAMPYDKFPILRIGIPIKEIRVPVRILCPVNIHKRKE